MGNPFEILDGESPLRVRHTVHRFWGTMIVDLLGGPSAKHISGLTILARITKGK